MSEASKMPARIWATCNGMSTRLPDGHRQFIGGWSEDKDRPRAEQFIRADIAEQMASVLKAIRSEMNAGLGSSYGETREQVRRALSAWEASNPARQASNGDRHAGEPQYDNG